MSGLVQNELIKIFEKKVSWIFAIILIVSLVAGALIYQKTGEKQKEDTWQESVQLEIKELQQQQNNAANEEEKGYIGEEIAQKQWYLDEKVNPFHTNWSFMSELVISMKSLVTLFIVIVCAGSISSEFSDGTIKQLLIRPYKRWAVLLSKYISLLIYSAFLCTVLLLFGYIVSLFFFGNGGFDSKIAAYGMDGIVAVSGGEYFFQLFLYYLPGLLMVLTIAFMLSTLFKNQAIAVGIGIFVLFFSSTIGSILLFLAEKYSWTKILLFPHLDQTVFVLQDKILENITMSMSLGILGGYYIVFMVVTFIFFQKRDISI
ncbi:ABC transporter permease [Niallia sp. NCCP-28]|uniref:ABC transporter permease n=1 Tax=Niallia sp. NCCP-28 TaxID=2934712 RepID=UPI00208CD517|nr:ABC transporter permease subunit [Niallia sp. NCCP-28]GKU83749.1 ABC transporter permease [Niallia sp. NCCP-28]